MRWLALAALLLLPGCILWHSAFGFPTTEHAVYCGQAYGIAVWWDGAHDLEAPMSCEMAVDIIRNAHDTGVRLGFWSPQQVWHYRLEFIDESSLTSVDAINADHSQGYTLTFSHVAAIGYQISGKADYVADFNDVSATVCAVIHEMIHMQEDGNAGHCGWTAKYGRGFEFLHWSFMQSWYDTCAHSTCTGYMCYEDQEKTE